MSTTTTSSASSLHKDDASSVSTILEKPKVTAITKPIDSNEVTDTTKPVGFIALFRFATGSEIALNILACILAAGAGAAQPAMTIIFANLTNLFTSFGIANRTIAEHGLTPELSEELDVASRALVKEAGHCSLYLLAIGVGTFLCTYAYMLIFNYTSEAQSKRLRERYLAAVLRQEVRPVIDCAAADNQIAWFDDVGAGEVATRIQTDCLIVQTAISEKIGISVQYLSSFVTGFVVAFARSPRLAGVLTAILPIILIAGGFGTCQFESWVLTP